MTLNWHSVLAPVEIGPSCPGRYNVLVDGVIVNDLPLRWGHAKEVADHEVAGWLDKQVAS